MTPALHVAVANKGIGLFATVNYEQIKDILSPDSGIPGLPVSDCFQPASNPGGALRHHLDAGALPAGFEASIDTKSSAPTGSADILPAPNPGSTGFQPAPKAQEAAWLNNLLSQSSVSGISCLIPWKAIEPSEDNYNWSVIDNLIDYCKKHNKFLMLRISTSELDNQPSAGTEKKILSDTPAWVFDDGAKSFTYTGVDQQAHRLPIFWDEIYIAKWSNFVKQLGARCDKNPTIHSIGITGGGILAGNSILLLPAASKEQQLSYQHQLVEKYGMNSRQLVLHCKYVADLFLKAFPTARLNFAIDPPTPDTSGEEILDDVCNYLVFRYGERVYLTRQNVVNSKHGFDQYRLILKYRPDTLTGYQISTPPPPTNRRGTLRAPEMPAGSPRSQEVSASSADPMDSESRRGALHAPALPEIVQCALDDGVSFAEVPAELILSRDAAIEKSVKNLADHVGYQLVAKEITLSASIKSGESLPASFSFLNLGAATPMKPLRELDKDKASSYKIELTLTDKNSNTVLVSLHTPTPPTNLWNAGKPIAWQKDLKMPQLAPGRYSVSVSLIDTDTKEKLNFLNALTTEPPQATADLDLGKIDITP